MDQVRIGSFIAQLRREKGWTQEELGEQIGVTNKTVSRWENGNYMPNIEILTLLGEKFGVSLNELLEGRRLDDDEEFRAAADKNLMSALGRPYDQFWKKLEQWLRRYGAFPLVTLALCMLLAVCCIGMLQHRQAHVADVHPTGTFACKDIIYQDQYTWIYFTLDYDGKYYVFNAAGERFEHGRYTLDGDVITLDDGETVRWIVIKGKQIHDEAPWGGELLTYDRVGNVPQFVNCDPKDFKK